MNLLVIALYASVFSTGYLAKRLGVIPSVWVLLPEALSIVALLIVLARLIASRQMLLSWRYFAFLGLFSFVLLFGFLAQSVPLGAVVSGLRNYVKFIPFFLLPAVYPFTKRQLKVQLGFLLAVLLVQSPLAVYQRFVQFAGHMNTGDPVRGTTTSSSALSMLMVCVIALLVTLYLHRRIRLPLLLCAVAVYFLPTTLNETKGTLLMMPVALLGPTLFMPRGSRSLRRIFPVAAVGGAALFAYVLIYNSLIVYGQYGHKIGTFLTGGYVESYLYTGASEGEDRYIGRIDSVDFAVQVLSADPLKFAFGLGAGNASHSSLPGFDGQYASYYERYGVDVTQVSYFLWEIGIVGLCVYLLLYWFVFQDARLLAKTDGPFAIYGQVWATVLILMTMALMYKSVFTIDEIAYLFWFYTGVVARSAYVERAARRAAAGEAARRYAAGRFEAAERDRVGWPPRIEEAMEPWRPAKSGPPPATHL